MKSIDEVLKQHFQDAGEQTPFGPLRVLIALSELAAPPVALPMRRVAVQSVVTKAKELAATLNPAQKAKLDCLLLCVATLFGAAALPQAVANDKRYKKSIGVTNMLKKATIERARTLASEAWHADADREYRLKDMARLVEDVLKREGCEDLPSLEQIKEWIKPVAPPHAREGGRPRKTP